MNLLVRHIEYLLRSGDACVVIPGIGALISHRVPARFDESAGRFLPPSVEYSFNSSIRREDGVLASSFARAGGITYENAVRQVEAEASAMRKALRSGSPVSLGRIGSLMSRDGSTLFIPFAYRLLASPLAWLEPVALRPLASPEDPSHEEDRPSDDASLLASVVKSAWRRTALRAGKIAASVALLLTLGFGVAMTLGRTAPRTENASLGFEFSRNAKPESALISRPGTSSSPLVLVIRHHDDAATVVDTASLSRQSEISAANPKPSVAKYDAFGGSDASYCLVVASLGSMSEAERYVASHGGNLRVLESDGRYRVYAASGNSSGAVLEKAHQMGIQDRYPGAWVCRK